MRRHEVDVVSLVFGLFFLGAAALWGTAGDVVRAARGWPLPLLLIGVGVIGLVGALATRRPRRQPEEPPLP